MPGPILHTGAVVTCAHGGQAIPTVPSPCVFVSYQACHHRHHRRSLYCRGLRLRAARRKWPCVTSQWVVGAVQVMSQGQPVAIMTGAAVCVPTGTPLISRLGADARPGHLAGYRHERQLPISIGCVYFRTTANYV
jgi:hypothetical protein